MSQTTETSLLTFKLGYPADESNDLRVAVTLPNRFLDLVGKPFTSDLANIVYTHVAGQFRNNQNANAKNRADRLEKLGDKATAEDLRSNRVYTTTDYLDVWQSYMPSVTIGSQRVGAEEKFETKAAHRAFVAIVAAHNALVASGEKSPYFGKYQDTISLPKRPSKEGKSKEQHAAAVAEVDSWYEGQRQAVLNSKRTSVIAKLDEAKAAIRAEELANKASKAEATKTAAPDLSALMLGGADEEEEEEEEVGDAAAIRAAGK